MLRFNIIGMSAKIALLYLLISYASITHVEAQDSNCSVSTFGLCQEFKALRSVIPEEQLYSITARHYRYDYRYRQAMNYIQTDEFKAISEEISATSAYQRMLLRFELDDVNTEDINSIAKIFNCILLPVPTEAELQQLDNVNNRYNNNRRRRGRRNRRTRSLQTYATDLMHALPRQEFVSVLTQHLDDNSQFKAFYEVVRSVDFHRQLLRDFAAPELKKLFAVLKSHFIDIPCLVEDAFKLFALGPPL